MFQNKIIIVLTISMFILGCTPIAMKSTPPPEAVLLPIPTAEGVLASGNKNLGRIDVGEGTNRNVQIEDDSYRVIYSEDELKKLSEITTYVIFPKSLASESRMDEQIHKRYKRVLKLIQRLDKVEVENDGYVSSFYENENIFVLFSQEKGKVVSIENYNYDLSKKVLKFFRKAYTYSLFREEGPYLITTVKNVWKEKEDFSFIYVNLSGFDNSAIDEMIGAYRERLFNHGINDITILEKIHTNLLSIVTNFSSGINIFQGVVSGWLFNR